jgi:hypothetical protein
MNQLRMSLSANFQRFVGILGLGLLATQPSYGQAPKTKPISTGRPDQTTGTSIVPRHALQLESGLRYQRGKTVRAYNYPALQLRYGLLDWLELRFGVNVQDSVRADTGRRPRGIGPPALGARLHLWEQHGLLPEAAFTAELTPPLGHEALRPAAAETRLRLGFTNSLSDKVAVTYTYGYGWLAGDKEQKYAAKLGIDFNAYLSGYAEFFGTTTHGRRPDNEADAGLRWRLRPNVQLDVAAGLGLSYAAPAYFVTTGFSIRLPH